MTTCEICCKKLENDENIVCDPCQIDRLEGLLNSRAWMRVRGPFLAETIAIELDILKAKRI